MKCHMLQVAHITIVQGLAKSKQERLLGHWKTMPANKLPYVTSRLKSNTRTEKYIYMYNAQHTALLPLNI